MLFHVQVSQARSTHTCWYWEIFIAYAWRVKLFNCLKTKTTINFSVTWLFFIVCFLLSKKDVAYNKLCLQMLNTWRFEVTRDYLKLPIVCFKIPSRGTSLLHSISTRTLWTQWRHVQAQTSHSISYVSRLGLLWLLRM